MRIIEFNFRNRWAQGFPSDFTLLGVNIESKPFCDSLGIYLCLFGLEFGIWKIDNNGINWRHYGH